MVGSGFYILGLGKLSYSIASGVVATFNFNCNSISGMVIKPLSFFAKGVGRKLVFCCKRWKAGFFAKGGSLLLRSRGKGVQAFQPAYYNLAGVVFAKGGSFLLRCCEKRVQPFQAAYPTIAMVLTRRYCRGKPPDEITLDYQGVRRSI